MSQPHSSKIKLDILFESDDILAINKPSGMLSIPDRFDKSLANAYEILKKIYPSIMVVHRIDKETSGVLCFAKNAEAHRIMNQYFENGEIEKTYYALCYSCPEIEEGMIDVPIAHSGKLDGKMTTHPRGKESKTLYKVMESWQKYSYVKVRPLTGRTHQIRVHMAYLNCPLIGESLYHEFEPLTISKLKPRAQIDLDSPENALMNRVALHAFSLSFKWKKQTINIEALLPKDMRASLNQMRKCLKNLSSNKII